MTIAMTLANKILEKGKAMEYDTNQQFNNEEDIVIDLKTGHDDQFQISSEKKTVDAHNSMPVEQQSEDDNLMNSPDFYQGPRPFNHFSTQV